LNSTHTVEDFLPAPEIAEISVDPGSGDEQRIIHDAVQQIYVINRDDFNTREILIVPEEERGKWFDDLRKNYPVRREFQNTKVVLTKDDATLARKLKGIGFKIG
jgi:erythronate-4-phosphate dehydrogenase